MVRSCRTWCCRDWRSSRRSRVRRMFRPGPRNLITDIPTLTVGHASDENVRSGVTALLCGAAWSAGVDVRGGGPGRRGTDALSPENLAGRAHAVVLAGGSVFALAAAGGRTSALDARDMD